MIIGRCGIAVGRVEEDGSGGGFHILTTSTRQSTDEGLIGVFKG